MRNRSAAELLADLKRLKQEADSGQVVPLRSLVPVRRIKKWGRRWALALAGLLGDYSRCPRGLHFLEAIRTFEPSLPPMKTGPFTTFSGDEFGPAFSPDGNQIAFSWNGEKEYNFYIYVKLIGGGPPLRLTSSLARDGQPAWSPDGRQIAFMRHMSEAETGIFLVPALGGPERKLGLARWQPWKFLSGPELVSGWKIPGLS